MNPRQQRAAERIRELIEQGRRVAALEQPSSVGPYIQDSVTLNAWRVTAVNIVQTVFGPEGPHYQHLLSVLGPHSQHSHEVLGAVGVLTGALSDLEGGYLVGQELLVAGDFFDSVLEQAKHLADRGFKDPAAVLVRVVVEDALRRLAKQEGMAHDGKASQLNDALRDKGRYHKPQWRIVQTWLDIGNSAAHGEFDSYKQADVLRMAEDVERFLAQELRP